jgi:hypothetical protein
MFIKTDFLVNVWITSQESALNFRRVVAFQCTKLWCLLGRLASVNSLLIFSPDMHSTPVLCLRPTSNAPDDPFRYNEESLTVLYHVLSPYILVVEISAGTFSHYLIQSWLQQLNRPCIGLHFSSLATSFPPIHPSYSLCSTVEFDFIHNICKRQRQL